MSGFDIEFEEEDFGSKNQNNGDNGDLFDFEADEVPQERDYDSDDDTGVIDADRTAKDGEDDKKIDGEEESDDDYEVIRIGLDIGGVLSDVGDKAVHLIDVPNALESIDALFNHHRTSTSPEQKKRKYKLYIVSYSSERRSGTRYNKIVANGHGHYFVEQYYVSDRNYKKYVLRHVNCHVMIDDKESILDDIKKLDNNIITVLFQQYNDQKKTKHRRHLLANSWIDVMGLLEKLELPAAKTTAATAGDSIYDMFEVKSLGPKCWFF